MEEAQVKLKWDQWVYGLGSAVVGGGASAVVAGLSSMLLAPQTFNITTGAGAMKALTMMGLCFLINGAISMFFYLKQSPLPPPVTGNTEQFVKPPQ